MMSRSVFAKTLLLVEILAVIFNLAYTVLYIKQFTSCFYFGMIGSALFVFLCFKKRIYAESFLQLFYIGFAIFGLLHAGDEWTQQKWPWWLHFLLILIGGVLTFISSRILKKYTDAKIPLVDAFTTVFSILATWIMVNFIHENWLYWMIINAVSIYLYANRKLYFGTFLFVIYFMLAIIGYFQIPIFT